MKRKTLLLVLWVLVMTLSSCFDMPEADRKGDQKDSVTLSIPYSTDGVYSGFSDIPDNYTVDGAISDGCLVIETVDDGTNAHGVDLTRTERTAGYEHWRTFYERSQRGEDAYLRVAHFIRGTGYYYDLYYSDCKYTIFELNEYGISEGESYTLLRRLDGMVGPVGNQREDHYYVLTDSADLTYNDVSWSYLSSSISTVTEIPFEWLSFLIYFE